MTHMQILSKNNTIHHTQLPARTKVLRKAKHLSRSGGPAEWQIVPHKRYGSETPMRRYARYQEASKVTMRRLDQPNFRWV